MAKAFSIIGLLISFSLLVAFGLDMAIGMPFKQASMTMDGCFVAASAVAIFLSWHAFREQR